MYLALILSIAGHGGQVAEQGSPSFYASTIRRVCEAHGTNPEVFQYWWSEPKFVESWQEGHKQYAFGAEVWASFWGELGRFTFNYAKSIPPGGEDRPGAWSEERCRELANALLIAVRPGTMWKLVSADYNELTLKATFEFDTLIGDLSQWTVNPHNARVTVDAASGALYSMEILAYPVRVLPADCEKNLTDAQYMARAHAAFASFRPYPQSVGEDGFDVVISPRSLANQPHYFTQRHLDMIAEKRGLRVRIVRFVRTGPQPRRSSSWQWVVLDANDGTPIGIIQENNAYRTDANSGTELIGEVRDISTMKFRALGSSVDYVSIKLVETPMPSDPTQTVVQAQDGSLWHCDFHLDSGLMRLKTDSKVFEVSRDFARDIANSASAVLKQPKMVVPANGG